MLGSVAAGAIRHCAPAAPFGRPRMAPQLRRYRARVLPHQIIAVAARLFAVWLTIHLPGQIYAFVDSDVKLHDARLRFFAVGIAIVELALILVLWLFPYTVARILLKSSRAEAAPPISGDTWLQIGCALIGMWLMATSLPALLLDTYTLSTETPPDDSSSLVHSVIYYLSQVVIGIWLILGASGFRRVVWWARNAGMAKPSNNRRNGP